MSFNYDVALSTAKDQVRFLIGDTDATDPQLEDETIIAVLTSIEPNYARAAVLCCRAIAALYSRLDDRRSEEQQESASQKAKAYLALATTLELKASRTGIIPYAGGISVADKQSVDDNQDRVAPAFTKDQFSEPGTEVNDPVTEPPVYY